MKLYIFLIITVLFFSCKKSDQIIQFKVDSSALDLEGSIDSKDSFTIESNINWRIEIPSTAVSWISITPLTGTGNQKIHIKSLEKNITGAVRFATVKIIATEKNIDQPIIVTIAQKPSNPIWTKLYGGTSGDFAEAVCASDDGGFVLAGTSRSNDGDVSTNIGHDDVWVMKSDANGNKIWSKTYGGSYIDMVENIAPTSDGGFVVTGRTWSYDGDMIGFKGNTDVFVIRIDANGNKMWSRTYGGSDGDVGNCIAQTNDGGFIIGVFTSSINGDISSNSDAWLFKIDVGGNIQWTKAIGGIDTDRPNSILINDDGTFLVAGTSYSTNNDFAGNHGSNDAWVMKLTAEGIVIWNKLYGGGLQDEIFSIKQLTDGYIAAGNTRSHDGDVVGNHGDSDAWIFKIDKSGNLLWQKPLGGTQWEDALSIAVLPNGGYIFTGTAGSKNGDVTGLYDNYGGWGDAWIVKLNADGSKNWDAVFGGGQPDIGSSITSIKEGSLIMVGYTSSNNGNVIGNHGSIDALAVKIYD